MSIFASLLCGVYKLSGAKKAFGLPEDEILKVIEKQNRSRGVFTPTDRMAYYETVTVRGFPCLIVRERPEPAERAILYFFGGGMVIGPDRGDLPVMRKLARDTGCDERVGTGRRFAMMTAGLQCYVNGRAFRVLSALFAVSQRVSLRVQTAIARMPAFSDYSSVFYDDRANHRIGAYTTRASLRKGKGKFHIFFVRHFVTS